MTRRISWCPCICLCCCTAYTLCNHISNTFYFLWYSWYFMLLVTDNLIYINLNLVLIRFSVHLDNMHNSAILPNFQHIILTLFANRLRKSQFMLLLTISNYSDLTLFLFCNDIVIPVSLHLFLLVGLLAYYRGQFNPISFYLSLLLILFSHILYSLFFSNMLLLFYWWLTIWYTYLQHRLSLQYTMNFL